MDILGYAKAKIEGKAGMVKHGVSTIRVTINGKDFGYQPQDIDAAIRALTDSTVDRESKATDAAVDAADSGEPTLALAAQDTLDAARKAKADAAAACAVVAADAGKALGK